MKKHSFKRIVSLVFVVVMLVISLTACSTKLNGTYTSDGIISQSFTFEDDDKVTISAFGINAEGTYKIEDDKITITYKLLNLSYDWEKSFEKDGDTITIDGTKFVKE